MINLTSPVNCRFEIPAETANALWEAGQELEPSQTGGFRKGKHYMRLSQDNKWLMRLLGAGLPFERQTEIMEREFERLHEHGVDVISWAAAKLPDRPYQLMVATPWLELRQCTYEEFASRLAPCLVSYYEDTNGRIDQQAAYTFVGPEITHAGQYSFTKGLSGPLLHDIDPNLVQGPAESNAMIHWLSGLTVQNTNSAVAA